MKTISKGPARAGLAAIALAAALLASPAPAASPVDVGIKDFSFAPSPLTVAPGTTVTWTNHDEETHTITSTSGAFGSAGLDLGEEYAHTFSTPGVYPYTCDLHPFMRGTIVVN